MSNSRRRPSRDRPSRSSNCQFFWSPGASPEAVDPSPRRSQPRARQSRQSGARRLPSRPVHSILEGVFGPPPASAPLPARPLPDAPISASIRSILLLMSNAITPETPDAALHQNPDLGTALIGRVATKSGGDDPVRLMNVPSLLAEFFIEAFAVDHPRAHRHQSPKEFPRATLIGVRLPEPILMSFASREPGKIQFGFFHTDFETAEEFQRRVSAVLSSIAQRRMLVAQFNSVDLQNLPDAAVAALARDLDLCMLRKSTGLDKDSECHSFVLKVMMSHWTPEREAAVRGEIARLEERARIAECTDCGMWYCPADNGPCPTTRAPHTEGASVTEVVYDTSPIFDPDPKYL